MYFQHANAKPLKHTFHTATTTMGTPKSRKGKNRQQIEKRAKGSQVFHINLKQLALRTAALPAAHTQKRVQEIESMREKVQNCLAPKQGASKRPQEHV